jgi:DNA sulfur modification protein DndD
LLLKDFRQYRNVKITFARGPNENFTIIQGANGAGKTNIMNALTWCLFGEEYHMDSRYAGLPIVNAHALDDNKNSIVEALVEIQFIDDNGKKIQISRSISYREKNGKLIEIPGLHAQPKIMFQTDGDWGYASYGEDAQFRINSLIPKAVEEYFFFDGEKMDEYFRKKSGTDIKTAVFDISQLGLFETLIEHLIKRKSEFVKQTKGLSPEVQNIQEELDIHNRSLQTDREQLENFTKKKNDAEALEQDFSKKLQNSSSDHIIGLEQQRVLLTDALTKLEGEIQGLEDERLELLHKAMPVIFSYQALSKTKAIINSRQESNLIPPMYRTIFIRNLLKNGKCICYSDISDKDEYSSSRRKHVESCLQQGELSEMSSEIIEANVRIQEMIERINDFPDEIREVEKKIKSNEEQKQEKNDKINGISEEIKQTDIEEIKNWEVQKRKCGEEKDHYNQEIGKQLYRMEQRQGRIKFCNIKLKQEVKRQAKYEGLHSLLSFCDESIKCAQDTKDLIMKEVKSQVEKKASEQFLALIWKKNTYQGLKIDDNYNISVPYIDGREALGTLSAGERQVCALSFMAALNSVSGFNIPIIIDTPLARISREPRKNIAENLPNYLSGAQVTLLVTEDEYTKEVQEALAKKVGKSYRINFQETERGKKSEVETND